MKARSKNKNKLFFPQFSLPAKFGAISWGLVINPEYKAPSKDTPIVNTALNLQK